MFGEAGKWRLCRQPEASCDALDAKDAATAAEQVFTAIGAGPPGARAEPWPDETPSAPARTAYAACRSAVSVALERAAVKGKRGQTKGLDADSRKALAANPN